MWISRDLAIFVRVRPLLARALAALAIGIYFAPGNSHAQTAPNQVNLTPSRLGPSALRPSLASEEAFRQLLKTPRDRYNFKIGPATALIRASFDTSYNSNVTISENPEPDLVISPLIGLTLDWVITKKNQLTIDLSLGYDYYLSHPDLNQSNFLITPDSEIALNIFVGDFIVRIYDRPQISQNAQNDPSLVNVANFSQFINIFGIDVTADLNKLILTLGGAVVTTRSTNGDFEGFSSNAYEVSAQAGYEITPTLQTGLFGSVSQTEYLSSVLNNYTASQAGLFAAGALSRYTSVSASVGLQSIVFQDTGTETSDFNQSDFIGSGPNGTFTDVSANTGGGNFFGPYVSIFINNRLNRYFDHNLALVSQAVPGASSDYTTQNSVGYRFNWRVNRFLTASAGLEYGFYSDSGASGQSFTYFQGGVALDYRLFRDWSFTTRILYTNRDSGVAESTYQQTIFTVGFSYIL